MHFFYTLLVQFSWALLHAVAPFNTKVKLFVKGRKTVFASLASRLSEEDKTVWVHAASLGEFEQGLPIIERIKNTFPKYKIVLTFFSPSGYEVQKKSEIADVVTYLPMDTSANAKRFLSAVHPQLAIFIKYEVWPNYLGVLQRQNVQTFLVSALFKPSQVYFRPYGRFMRKALKKFDHFFVQNESSKKLLASIDINKVTVSGDTRFDRVAQILERDNHLEFMQVFKGQKNCLVVGSSWPEDEKLLISFINTEKNDLKFVIAPHDIKPKHIEALVASFDKKVMLYSELDITQLPTVSILIVDTIGLLTKIYSYADIAYVGGGFATGLHNTLEPAVFGIPVIIGPNYHAFQEARDLVRKKGIFVVEREQDLNNVMKRLLKDSAFLAEAGGINKNYLEQNRGATDKIMDHLKPFL